MLSDSSILRHIGRQPKKTASYKQLLRELSVRADGRRELADRLHSLVQKGELLEVDSDRYAIPQTSSSRNMFVGRLSMHRDGFGFVIPQANSLNPDLKARLAGDVFIPPPATGSAMHGDQVLVEITAFRPDGRAEGRIIRALTARWLVFSTTDIGTTTSLQWTEKSGRRSSFRQGWRTPPM